MLTNTQLAALRNLLAKSSAPLDDWDAEIALIEAEIAEVRALHQEIAALLPSEDVPGNFFTRRDRKNVNDDLFFLVHGVVKTDGVTDRRLVARIGQPGLAKLERFARQLRAGREREVARQARAALPWPRPHRVRAWQRRRWHDGRYVSPGDVVLLNEAQASAFADIFEPVDEAVASEASRG